MILSPTDISIDILVVLLWWLVIYRSISSIIINNISFRWKVYLAGFSAVGILFTFQTILQIQTGVNAIVWVWDILNVITMFMGLTMSTALFRQGKT